MVGLIEDGDGDVGKVNVTLTLEVFEAAGGSDDDVDTAAQAHHLRTLGHAPDDCGGEESDGFGDRHDRSVDLLSQFTRRRKNQRARQATLCSAFSATVFHQSLDERRTESDRFAGTGTTASENVSTREDIGNGRRLNRERRGCTEFRERLGNVAAQAEVLKRNADNVIGCGCHGLKTFEDDVLLRSPCLAFGL